jgi:hypothetical protein
LTLQGKFWALEKAFVTPKPRFWSTGAGECDRLASRDRVCRHAFGPGLHHEPGRSRDRRRAGRAPGAQCADQSRFAFRAWTFRFAPPTPGKRTILARASNVIGQTQAESLIFNPAGYHNNVPLALMITVA